MSKRMDIMSPRKGRDNKTFWTRLGTAWFNDNGGIQLVFDALPIPDSEGRVVANLFEPRERTEAPRQTQPARSYAGSDLDDDPPFVTCDPALERRVR